MTLDDLMDAGSPADGVGFMLDRSAMGTRTDKSVAIDDGYSVASNSETPGF